MLVGAQTSLQDLKREVCLSARPLINACHPHVFKLCIMQTTLGCSRFTCTPTKQDWPLQAAVSLPWSAIVTLFSLSASKLTHIVRGLPGPLTLLRLVACIINAGVCLHGAAWVCRPCHVGC